MMDVPSARLGSSGNEPELIECMMILANDCEGLFDEVCGNESVSSVARRHLKEASYRFDSWASDLGVSEGDTDSLNHMVRRCADFQDMTVRLLDILRMNLAILSRSADVPKPTGSSHGEAENDAISGGVPSKQKELVMAIEESINRLHVLVITNIQTSGTTVARSSNAQPLDLDAFGEVACHAVATLYPEAPATLIQQMCDCMIDRYAKIKYNEYRLGESNTKHFFRADDDDARDEAAAPSVEKTLPSRAPVLDESHRQNDMEPTPPKFESGKDLTSCNWCSQRIDRSLTEGSGWSDAGRHDACRRIQGALADDSSRQHYMKDLQPFVCISEKCAENRPSYASRNEWFDHMKSHSAAWSQDIHKCPTWQCHRGHDNGVTYTFPSPSQLNDHMLLHHGHQVDCPSTAELVTDAVACDTRPVDGCPLCGFVVTTELMPQKRRQIRNDDFQKRVKSSAKEDRGFHARDAVKQTVRPAMEALDEAETYGLQETTRTLGSHIADHLQHLMLLSLRLMDISNATGEDGADTGDASLYPEFVESQSHKRRLGGYGSVSHQDHSHLTGTGHVRDQAGDPEPVLSDDIIQIPDTVPSEDNDWTQFWGGDPTPACEEPDEEALVSLQFCPDSIHTRSGRNARSRILGIKVLYDCPNATVDICFVHGPTGDDESTWTPLGQSAPWPQTLLPREVPQARILTFGYDVCKESTSAASSNRLVDHARDLLEALTSTRVSCNSTSRPLIFVAHSFGGLVCKETILRSEQNTGPFLRDIFDSIEACIFISTPHQGPWVAHWDSIPASAVGIPETTKSLFGILGVDRHFVRDVQLKFLSMTDQLLEEGRFLKIACFYETLSFPGVGTIVSKESATLHGYNFNPVHANHTNISKFTFEDDVGFRSLLAELSHWKIQAENTPLMWRDTLRLLEYPQMHDSFHAVRNAFPGTCEWLPDHPVCRKWAAGARDVLLIEGGPGSGKSTLLKHVLSKHLLCSNDSHKDVFVARNGDVFLSFFFHFGSHTLQRSPVGLFRSLLCQVINQAPDVMRDLLNVSETAQRKLNVEVLRKPLELERLFTLSLEKLRRNRRVWLFIDALDECNGESKHYLYKWLHGLPFWHGDLKRLHACVTSRHDPRLSSIFTSVVRVEEWNGKDISALVHGRSAGFKQMPPTIPADIMRQSDGVFLLANAALEEIERLVQLGSASSTLEAHVRSTPRAIDELCRSKIRTMSPASSKLMQLMCVATRSLSLDELRWAMVVDADCSYQSVRECQRSETFTPDNDTMKRQVQTLSCYLAEVTTMCRAQFAHQSFASFFINEGLFVLDGHSSSSNAALGKAHFRLCSICISYLAMEEVDRATSSSVDEMTSDFPFLRYAATSWLTHAEQADANGISPNELLDMFAWPSNSLVDLWVRLCRMIDDKDRPPLGTTVVHLLSRYQIAGPLAAILEKGEQTFEHLHVKDETGRTPLSWAAENGHAAAVKLLLDHGAYLDCRDDEDQTPLLLAVKNGHTVTIELLLEKGADPRFGDKEDPTPLLWAAKNGHLAFIELLLEKGADLRCSDKEDHTPLLWAAKNDHTDAIKLLLDHGADLRCSDKEDQTPLLWAAKNGHIAATRLLLDHGADLHWRDKEGRTSLLWAAKNGRTDAIRYLLLRGAYLNCSDKEDQTPLLWAAKNGHTAATKLLLQKGADLHWRDKEGRTPLSWAAANGHEATTKSLLERGAEVDSKDRHGRSPLSWAAGSGREAVVRMLLEKGAHIDSKDKSDRTPLLWATENMHEAITKLLLDRGPRSMDVIRRRFGRR